MKAHLNAGLLLLLCFSAQAAQLPERPPEKAVIEGMVLKAGADEPLARVQIQLLRVRSEKEREEDERIYYGESEGINAPVLTGVDGKFMLADIEPGQYRLSAGRNGYVAQTYGSKGLGSRGTVFDLQPGRHVKDIVFQMVQGGVVTGRVRDSLGEPLPGLLVTLAKVGYGQDGKKILRQNKTTTTDDRGEYRLYWVEPGRYYVRVSQTRGYSETLNDRVIPPVYYPGLMTPENATVIEVQPGGELAAVDIVAPQASTSTIRGRVVDAATGKPPKNIVVQISPKTNANLSIEYDNDQHTGRYNAATGAFEVRDVFPGTYWLGATVRTNFGAPIPADQLADVKTNDDLFRVMFDSNQSAQLAVEVTDADLTDIVITLTNGVTVPVRVSVEGQDLSAIKDFENIRVNLIATSDNTYRGGTRTNREGASKIDRVQSGEYKISVELGTKELYVKDIRYGRTGALDEAAQISEQLTATITVLLSSGVGQIEGNLVDAMSQPVTGATVVLIPSDRDKRRLYKEVETDHKGHFLFRAVPPGGYKVFSWENTEYMAYYDSEVISKYETQGQPAHILESSRETVELKIIPAQKP